MPQFAYRARNSQGGLVEGVLDCADRAIAIRQIESQQCIPVRIEMVGAEPKVVAKGAGYVAERIKAIAQEHAIPLIENKPIAQQLFKTIDIGETIPEGLYKAVAEILAYVYRLEKRG